MTALDWQADAACRGVGSGAFFPGREDVDLTADAKAKLRAARNRQAA